MSKYIIDGQTLTDIADKLRVLKGSNAPILAGDYASEVEGVGNTLKSLIEGSAVNLIIPYGTTTINTYAFTGFTSLKSVIIPNTVTIIGNTAFSWCTSLKSVKMPKSIVRIDANAFVNCTSCLEYDFSDHDTIPQLGSSAFGIVNNVSTYNPNMKIIVPEGLYNDFCYATNWADYHNNLVSVGESGMDEVPIETIWLMSSGSYRYVSNKSVSLKAYYKIDDWGAVEFSYNNPAFGGLRFNQMYDGDTGYYMSASGTLSFSIPGTYEIWVEDSSTGVKYYRRIIEVSA